MAAKIWLGAGYHTSNVSAASSTRYTALGGTQYFHDAAYTAEALAQQTCRNPGTVSNLRVRVPSNSRTATTVTFRKNGADAAPTLTITASTTGTFEDTSNSVALADGDLYDVAVTTGTGTANMHLAYVYCDYDITGSLTQRFCASNNDQNLSTASVDRFDRFCGLLSASTTESSRQSDWRAGTASNFLIGISSNARSTTTTFRFRVNGADGNQVISVGSGVTGTLEDTTNTDSIVVNDSISMKSTTGTGTGTLRYGVSSFVFDATSGKQFVLADGGFSHNTTCYWPLIGGVNDVTTESQVQFPLPFAVTMSELRFTVTSNASTVITTFNTRVNGANGALTASVGAGATGTFADLVNSQSLSAGDLLNYQSTGQNGAINASISGILVAETVAGGNLFMNLAGSGGLAGMGGLAGQGGGLAG